MINLGIMDKNVFCLILNSFELFKLHVLFTVVFKVELKCIINM